MTATAFETTRSVSRPGSPYVGLAPYGEDDADFFFGRSQEVAIASANLRSARLTILYGPSGVGKSSLLQAGVVHGLREQSHTATDESPFAICTVRSWLDDPIQAVQQASRAALEELAGDEALNPAQESLAESLRVWTEQAGTLLVVLDQFEDYFQYHEDEDGETLTAFAAELAAIVNDPNLAVNVLLSIREDAWAKLDRFEGHIPLLFANYIRVDHLDVDAAREAIEAPIAAWNATLEPGSEPFDIEPALIGAVLTAAAAGMSPDADAEKAESPGDRVEAPFLQLVLERLWRATVADGAVVLTLARLEALGGARRIVERHLLDALAMLSASDRNAASDCFRFLVSSSKTKIAHPAVDLAEWTGRSEAEVTTVLEKLCSGESGRILRAVATGAAATTSYELFHDVLAEPILAWRREHERELSRRAARRRLLRVGSVALALIAIFAGLSVWALVERSHANDLLHEQEAASQALRDRLRTLNADLKKQQEGATAQTETVKELTATNQSLTTQTAQLQSTSDDLNGQVASLRKQNKNLEKGIVRFNAQNGALAARINNLDDAFDSNVSRLDDLSSQRDSLLFQAGILRAESGALQAQRRALARERDELLRKALALGYVYSIVSPHPVQAVNQAPPRPPTTAKSFGIPAALPGSDALRRRVEALQRQLAELLERRARQTNAETFFRRANRLLTRQRTALRKENAQLQKARAALAARSLTLQSTLAAAGAEHASLSSKAATRAARNRVQRRAVDRRLKTNTTTQERNNGTVDTIGSLQGQIDSLHSESRRLVRFIAPPVDKLVQSAQDSKLEAALAGLLAVKAYTLTPFGPDDAAHPGVYNALWLALSRLDANTAHALIAPVVKKDKKVGTTKSAVLVGKICGLVKRGFTQDEWKRFLPERAPYTPKSPCP